MKKDIFRERNKKRYIKGQSMDDLLKSSFEILGIYPGASREDIEKTFKKIKSELSANKDDWDKLKEINRAYENLIDYITSTKNIEDVRENKAQLKKSIKSINSDKTTFKNLFFSVGEKINVFAFSGRLIIFIVTLIWGFQYITHSVESNYVGNTFLHNVNLPFHEAGHIIFSFFGDFMGILGGSLFQLIVPAICMITFFKKNNLFGASLSLWWIGQNFVDCAPYINDARVQELILIGGVTGQDIPGFHDWNNILGALGLLEADHLIANTFHWFGISLMIVSFLWGGSLLFLQRKHLE